MYSGGWVTLTIGVVFSSIRTFNHLLAIMFECIVCHFAAYYETSLGIGRRELLLGCDICDVLFW